MACTTHGVDFGHCGDRTARIESGVSSWLRRLARRLSDALDATRQRDVDREMARLLARSGVRITDSIEREMMRKVLESDWSLPQ